MLPKRALHSANGWLMCRVFCKSIMIRFSPVFLSNSDASLLLEAQQAIQMPNSVRFLYNTVSAQHAALPSRIEHNSPSSREFDQVFS